jgi:hypothetical protein
MPSLAERLIDLAKSVEPSDGFGGYYDLVDALEAKPSALDAEPVAGEKHGR